MRLCVMLVAAAVTASGGCAKPNLGDAPFYCNNGYPECPEGYVCDPPGAGALGRCVKPGTTVPPPPDGAVLDLQPAADQPTLADRGPKPDSSRPPDGPGVKWDKGPVDLPGPDNPKPDAGNPPHLGCQSDSECASDPSMPCCCPMPYLPGFWTCLPLCLAPLCM